VPVEFRRWSLEGELDDYRGIAIGLMPLDDTPWARGKCAFKLLQYLALGLPSIASPVGMNRDVVEDGRTALLASSDRAWVQCLDRLLQDREQRRRLGRAGRQSVLRDFDLPIVSRQLVAALESVGRARPGTEGKHGGVAP
jgi:hypothetical protein